MGEGKKRSARDSMRREIRKITPVTYSPLPFHPGKEKFMVFRKYSGGNRYGNFLRHTFDKVRGITMRVRVVWLLLPSAACYCCSCSETLACGASFREDTKTESRAKFHFRDGTRANRTRSKPHRTIGDDIFFRHGGGAGVIHRRETFYIMLTCARNGPLPLPPSRTKQHVREVDSKFEDVPVIVQFTKILLVSSPHSLRAVKLYRLHFEVRAEYNARVSASVGSFSCYYFTAQLGAIDV